MNTKQPSQLQILTRKQNDALRVAACIEAQIARLRMVLNDCARYGGIDGNIRSDINNSTWRAFASSGTLINSDLLKHAFEQQRNNIRKDRENSSEQ